MELFADRCFYYFVHPTYINEGCLSTSVYDAMQFNITNYILQTDHKSDPF